MFQSLPWPQLIYGWPAIRCEVNQWCAVLALFSFDFHNYTKDRLQLSTSSKKFWYAYFYLFGLEITQMRSVNLTSTVRRKFLLKAEWAVIPDLRLKEPLFCAN